MRNNLRFNLFIMVITIITLGGILSSCAVMSGRESTGEYVDDTAITSKVKIALAKNEDLKVYQIHVETFQGTVQLSGFVDSIGEKEKAGGIAWLVKGVGAVTNNLEVRTPTR